MGILISGATYEVVHDICISFTRVGQFDPGVRNVMSVLIRLKHSRCGVKRNGAGLPNRLNNMDIKNSH